MTEPPNPGWPFMCEESWHALMLAIAKMPDLRKWSVSRCGTDDAGNALVTIELSVAKT